MRYACLLYFAEKELAALSDAELGAMTDRCLDREDELRESGHLLAVEALAPVHAATTLRVRDGRAAMTDGPFAETREQLGGFFLIEARDLNEALQVAETLPQARLGSIEVRPVRALRRSQGTGATSAARAR